jgi:hypothetical protein
MVQDLRKNNWLWLTFIVKFVIIGYWFLVMVFLLHYWFLVMVIGYWFFSFFSSFRDVRSVRCKKKCGMSSFRFSMPLKLCYNVTKMNFKALKLSFFSNSMHRIKNDHIFSFQKFKTSGSVKIQFS